MAPSPSGYLHLGHVATFLCARKRAGDGVLILRNDDLDPHRSQGRFVDAFLEDLKWLGIRWDEGPDIGGPFEPYSQSQRRSFYLDAWQVLKAGNFIYPCPHSRKDIQHVAEAPHGSASIFPVTLRSHPEAGSAYTSPEGINWRFRVPDGESIIFDDERLGPQSYLAGKDFGDFVLWNRDNIPAYELAAVCDDHAMNITEIVRAEDLLVSTARQILLYRALGWVLPAFFHTPLVCDNFGERLAKRHDALSIRILRERGHSPESVLKMAEAYISDSV
tara:strand:+ start:151 stop:975 length:825 start_codon:yes stop_codon:yes gene_type:complete